MTSSTGIGNWRPDRTWKERMEAPFLWTKRKEEAAFLIATFASTAHVAESLGVAEQTVWNWNVHPDFKAKVHEIKAQLREERLNVRIADMAERVQILDALQKKYLDLIAARGEEMAGDTAGADTGLLVRREKRVSLGGGSYTTNIEFEADTAVTAEIRALQDLAAKDLGQRVEKRELNAQLGIRREFVVVDNSDDPPLTEAELDSLPDPDTIEAEFEELS